MEKVRLGRTDMMVSRIGFGGIPINGITEDDAIAVVKRSLDLGINYIDTAPMYGTSEERIGKAIAGREGVLLTTKTHAMNHEEVKNDLDNSLKTLGREAIDLYQFHSVSDFKTYESITAPNGLLSVVQEARQAGKIKHIGISSHQIDVAKAAIISGYFETIMFPFNFIANEAADELLPLAREHDVGFIAMKSLAGGRIDNIKIAMKYLFQFPDIVVLPGIGKIEEIEEIIGILEDPQMTPAEQDEMLRLREQLSPRFCRHCDYCQPCSQNLAIVMLMDFEAISRAFSPERLYEGDFAETFKVAATCDDCGECEKRCPYDVKIRELISEYVAQYEDGRQEYEASLKK